MLYRFHYKLNILYGLRDIYTYGLNCNAHLFYARQLYRQVLLRARISYGNSVRPSVHPSVLVTRPGTESSPGEIETLGFYRIACSLGSLASDAVSWCRWVRRFL